MPFFDIQKRLGIDLDRWITIQSAEQPHRFAARCHAFEKEWINVHMELVVSTPRKCKIEYDDLVECPLWQKTMKRLSTVMRSQDELMKERYTPPPHHSGKEDLGPEQSSCQC